MAVTQFSELSQSLAGGGAVVHAVGAVDLGGDGVDLVLEGHFQRVGVLDGTVLHDIQHLLGQSLAALAALGEDLAQDAGDALLGADLLDVSLLFGGIGREGVDGHHDGQAEAVLHVVDVADEVGCALLDGLEVGSVQVGLGYAAVALESTEGRHQHAGAGRDARIAALDVQELLCAQVCAEAGLGDDVVGQREAELGAHDAVAAVGDVGEGAAVDDGGVVLEGLDQVRVEGVLQQGGHGTGCADVSSRDGLAVVGVGADDLREALFQIGDAGGEAEDGHDLAGDGDVETVLAGRAVDLTAQAVHDKAELTVVHVHAALPGDAAGVDVQGVALLDAVVNHGRQQVVGGTDGVDVAGEVEVDVLHRHHLCVAAAGCAALHAEDRAEGGFTEAEHGLFAYGVHGVGQTHAGGRLAFTGGGGADGRDEDELALLRCLMDEAVVYLGLIAAIGNHVLVGEAQTGGDVGDGLHFGFLCDLDVRLHIQHPP